MQKKNLEAKTLWKQFFGWRELALNGVNYLKNTANGIAFLADSMAWSQKNIWQMLLEFCADGS